jgi:hypothetical protein
MITSSTPSRPTSLFHFYDANHLYLMKIALTRKNKNNNTTPRYKSSIAKKTYLIKLAKLVLIFAARWRSICKRFTSSDNKQLRRRKQIWSKCKKKPVIYAQATNPKIKSKKETRQKLKQFQLLKANSIRCETSVTDYRREISSDNLFYNAKSSILDEIALIRMKYQKNHCNQT